MTETHAPTRPRGTTALISGVLLLGVGGGLWLLGLAGWYMVGSVGVVAVATGVGYLVAGVVLRLAGGPDQPLRLRRTVRMAVGIPLLVAAFALVMEILNNLA